VVDHNHLRKPNPMLLFGCSRIVTRLGYLGSRVPSTWRLAIKIDLYIYIFIYKLIYLYNFFLQKKNNNKISFFENVVRGMMP